MSSDSDSSLDDYEERWTIDLIDDRPPSISHCKKCFKEIPRGGDLGFELCESCCPSDGERMADFVDELKRYGIDRTGMIWSGLPDELHPEMSLQQLPIYQAHPNLQLFHRFPLTKFAEQMEIAVRHRRSSSAKGKQPQIETLTFGCFICGQQHAVLPPKSQPMPVKAEIRSERA